MTIKICVGGKICTGKSSFCHKLMQRLKDRYNLKDEECSILPMSSFLKYIATTGFGMDPNKKDRTLLQKIADSMRSIDEDVFANVVVNQSKNYKLALNDDTRYVNDARKFVNNGWILVKLVVDEDIRMKRLMKLYPNTKISEMQHSSETSLDTPEYQSLVHLFLNNNNEQEQEQSINILLEHIQINYLF